MQNNYYSTNFLDYSVFAGPLNSLPGPQKVVVTTINQYSYCMAERDPGFKRSLQESDVLLPDGIGIVVASRFLNGGKIFKIAGADLHKSLLEQLNQKKGSCFYLGSSEKTLIKVKERLSVEHPAISVGTYSPPFKSDFTEKENEEMIKAVNAFKPDVLFIGMTAPKQEKWSHAHKDMLEAKVICSIGAVFDFYAGTVKRPHNLWINLGMEWFGRLIKEPKRMWKRYLYYGPVFCYCILKEKVRQFLTQLHTTALTEPSIMLETHLKKEKENNINKKYHPVVLQKGSTRHYRLF